MKHKTFGRARLSFANEAEIDEFVATLEKYERGEITPDQWRVYRLVRGTYGQRQAEDAQMLRVKIPQGLLTADQLDVLAEIGERYSRGFGHITTRQNIQFHFVKLHDVEPAMRLLADAGHHDARSVRQLGAEHHGVPVRRRRRRRTVRRHAVRRSDDALPAAAADQLDAAAQVQDCVRRMPGRSRAGRHQRSRVLRASLGPDGSRGFRVTAGGGTAILCKTGTVIHEFLPASEIFRVAQAVLRVFHRFGDYKHKQRNRMKFMIRELGWTRWREEYDRELTRCRLSGEVPTLEIDPPRRRTDAGLDQGADRRRSVTSRRASAAQKVNGPGIVPTIVPLLQAGRRGLRPLARDERAAAEAVRLSDGDRHRSARRSCRARRCGCSANSRARTATGRSA